MPEKKSCARLALLKTNIWLYLAVSLLIINSAHAEFHENEFPPNQVDGPHRRHTEIPRCNKLHVHACFSYDSPRCPSSSVWLVSAAKGITIHEWFVSGIPNMPARGWKGGPGLAFEPNTGTIRWKAERDCPPINSGTRAHPFGVPGLQNNPESSNSIAAMVITFQVGTEAQKQCRYPVRHPVISTVCEPRNCVVNSAAPPAFNCAGACSSIPQAQATRGASSVLTQPFPTTLTAEANSGSTCPLATTTCICAAENCVTGAAVSSTTSGTEPNCSDRNVPSHTIWGTATTAFAVSTPARFGGECTSTIQSPLRRDCPCDAFPVTQDDCAPCTFMGTSRIASDSAVSTGTQACPRPTRIGCPAVSPLVQTCTGKLSPTNCVQEPAAVCPQFTCAPNQAAVPASITTDCPFPTITPAANGGSSCTQNPVQSTIPLYENIGCECSNFSSTKSEVNSSKTTLTAFGQDVCTSRLSPQATATSCNAVTTITGGICSTTRVSIPTGGQTNSPPTPSDNVWPPIDPSGPQVPCSGGPNFTGGSHPVRCMGTWLQDRFTNLNGIFYGSLTFTGKVEGRLAVAGNATFDDFSVGSELPNANKPCVSGTGDDFVLSVGGRLTIDSGRVYGGIVINAAHGSSGINSQIQLNPNCFVTSKDSNRLLQAFEAHRLYSVGLSTHLLMLVPTLSIQWDDDLWGWKVVRIRESVTGTFDVLTFPHGVTKVNVGNWDEVVNHIIGSRTLIVNLPGVSVDGWDYEPLKPISDRIIWNWGPSQTSVTIKLVSLYGSVLAPAASISGSGSIYGQVVAVTSSGLSLHNALFRGCTSPPGSGPDGGLPGTPGNPSPPIVNPRPPTGNLNPNIPLPPPGGVTWPSPLTNSDGPQVSCSGGPDFTGGSHPVRCIGAWLQDRFRIFNGIFYGSLIFTGKVEGRLAVGGNGNFDDYSVGSELRNAEKACISGSTDDAVLAVGGRLTIDTGRVYGGIVVNKSQGTSGIRSLPQLNPNCFARGADSNQLSQAFEAHRQYAIGLSTHLLALHPTLSIQWSDDLGAWKVIRVCHSRTGTFDVLKFPEGVTRVNIGNWNEVVSSIIGQRTLIINLPGVAIAGTDFESSKPAADRIIWNWGPHHTNVTIKNVRLYGSVLAPAASITGSGSIYGQVVAVTSSGLSLHLAPFRGCISSPGSGADGGLS